jgi:branched-chain amino acid transport system permease protein
MSVSAWPWAHILATGFSLGSFYALVALGFSLIFLWKFYQVPFLLTFGPCSLALALLALPLCLLLRRLKEPYALNTLVVTFGLALLLQNLMLVLFSADYRLIRSELANSTFLGTDFPFSINQIILVVLSLLTTGAVHVLLHHTFLGKALRATIQDSESAQMAGINIKLMAFVAFGLGGMLIGLAGPLYGENMYLYPTAGTGATLIAIILTIFAGVGRIRTLLLGGWLLGLAESATILTLGSKWRELVAAAVLLTLLTFRPEGISTRRQE